MVDVRTDRNVQSADVICFLCETRYDSRDSVNDTSIPDFTQYRQDYQGSSTAQRSPYGLAIYSKFSFTFGPCIETRDVGATVFSVQQRPDVVIVFIYKSPKVSNKALLDFLQQIHTKYVKSAKAVLLGDFNIDWTSESFEKHALEKLMTHKLHYDKQSKNQLLITTQQSTSCSLTSKHTNVE